jgi:hypothetical protein
MMEFVVPMFKKRLYGKYKMPGKVEACYANWDMCLHWEDELEGAL